MARQLSNKRDQEKKKLEKRKEKQKRKEERLTSNAGKSFEDMIAYVDENGQLSSTPPEPKKEKIDIEEIQISVPKKSDIEEIAAHQGFVEYFNKEKGYGFIKSHDKKEKYFFHVSVNPVDNIAEGQAVSFELRRNARGMEVFNLKIE